MVAEALVPMAAGAALSQRATLNSPGGYEFEVIPAAGGRWVAGTWTVVVRAAAGDDRGQTLASFTIRAP